MKLGAGSRGTFVISWAQTQINGSVAAPVSSLVPGARWAWCGNAVRIDHASTFESAPVRDCEDDRRYQVIANARRLVSRALAMEGVPQGYETAPSCFDRSFRLTDGQNKWEVTLIEMSGLMRPLLLVQGTMPPKDAVLQVEAFLRDPKPAGFLAETAEGVVCFTPGTMIETPKGQRPVEELVAGDKVVTKDSRAQTIVWAGQRNVSGARLYAFPDLRPVRIRAGGLGFKQPQNDLLVSPDHRMLIRGKAAQSLWGEDEVLVAARDLIDGTRIARDLDAKSVTYHHLMLEHHQILIANGLETESFHPAAASLDAIEDDQRLRLFDVMPELANHPEYYGPMSRRSLNTSEANLLRNTAA